MSNYAVVIFANSEKRKIRAWLEDHGTDRDVYQTPLSWNRTLLIISKDIDLSIGDHTYFRGTAFNAELRAIIFGLRGWLDAPTPVREQPGDHNGEYCVITWSRAGVQIDRDIFGNARLLTTFGDKFVGASDSLVVLASLRKALGETLSINTEAMLARATLNNTAGQQMSPDTMFREIEFVPAGFGTALTATFRSRRTGAPMADRLVAHSTASYATQVREIATQISETVAGLASIPNWSSTLSLSGGYDSRVVFGAARLTGAFGPVNYTSANSSPVHARDFEVATGLAKKFGMSTNANPNYVKDTRPEQAMTLWAASLLDVYDGFGPSRTTRGFAQSFTITGIGAELLKGNWGWKRFSELADGFERGIVRDAYELQGRKGIRALGGGPESDFASELYYVGYRNGLHSAAGHVGVHMTGIHPLQQFRLAQLGHSQTEIGHAGSPATVADISILIDAEVASYEYDTPDRNISPRYAQERLRALGGAIDPARLEPLRVYGDPDSVPAGPSRLSLSIARSIGAVGTFDKELILRLGAEGLEALPTALRPTYEALVEHAEWRIGKVNGNVPSAGASSARIASLLALKLV